ncbi:Metallo-dependent hydrolase [Trichodelitschia bisporula]|uniref:N-acetylglucosamine-6-phosphate deacetylase n=1 Tax=Trichodelitschia bisporula TaxID=703511 RepID=A0A6G1IA36_9PEZI|nr:Metallo-dependent hydrolase [Trichodelitschia bisporula]
MPAGFFTTLTNCRLCIDGEIVEGERLVVSEDTGRILQSTGYIGGEIFDLEDAIIAPGFLELHTNGANGFHFSDFQNEAQYTSKLQDTAQYYVEHGVTGFWATLPTVSRDSYQKILPALTPRRFDSRASLLGAHLEGPYLHPSKSGAHSQAHLTTPQATPLSALIPLPSLPNVKLCTLSPDLPLINPLITRLTKAGTRISLGHSPAPLDTGLSALSVGATCLTHAFNAMAPLHHRNPGLLGLITLPETHVPPPPYFTIVADGVHMHPSVATLLYRAAPRRAILVSDATELAGLPDGAYTGPAATGAVQQVKEKGAAWLAGEGGADGERTLVGSTITVDGGVRNLVRWSGCSVAEAVRCVTENVAGLMGLEDRGKLEEGRWADFVVLDDEGEVLETWVAAKKVWERK